MALKKLNFEVSDLTSGLLRDAKNNLQSERPVVLFQNEQLEKHNAELQAKNAQLQAEVEALKQRINQQAPMVDLAKQMPELLVNYGKREQEVKILKQQLEEAKIFITTASAQIPGLQQQLRAKDDEIKNLQSRLPELQQQLRSKDDEIKNLQSRLETAEKAPKTSPKAPPPEAAAARMPVSSAGNGRPAGKVSLGRSSARPVRTAKTGKPAASRTRPLAGRMNRLIYLYKLAKEMELRLWMPEEFCHLAELAIGFDKDMCRIFVKHIREEAKCQSYKGSSFSFLDECRKDMEKVFSIPRMSRKNKAR